MVRRELKTPQGAARRHKPGGRDDTRTTSGEHVSRYIHITSALGQKGVSENPHVGTSAKGVQQGQVSRPTLGRYERWRAPPEGRQGTGRGEEGDSEPPEGRQTGEGTRDRGGRGKKFEVRAGRQRAGPRRMKAMEYVTRWPRQHLEALILFRPGDLGLEWSRRSIEIRSWRSPAGPMRRKGSYVTRWRSRQLGAQVRGSNGHGPVLRRGGRPVGGM